MDHLPTVPYVPIQIDHLVHLQSMQAPPLDIILVAEGLCENYLGRLALGRLALVASLTRIRQGVGLLEALGPAACSASCRVARL